MRMHSNEDRNNNNLRRAMDLSGIQLYELADRLGVSSTTLSLEIKFELSVSRERYLIDIVKAINAEKQAELAEIQGE